MSNDSATDVALLEQLSALADGELDDASASCAGWCREAELRGSWHAYQLIGDVLRSDDLAVDPAHDAAFLSAFRERLAREPVAIAPRLDPLRRPSAAHPSRLRIGSSGGWMWKAGSVVGAGFVAVAGVFLLTRSGEPAAPVAATLARAEAPVAASGSAPELRTPAPESGAAVATLISNGNVIRDVRLDSYLAAHKQFAGSSALVVPSAFLRSAMVDSPGR